MKISELFVNVRSVLVDDGTRWTDEELLSWLNESYGFILLHAPEANSVIEEFTCVQGAKQSIPPEGLKLLDVIRNTDGSNDSIIKVDKDSMDCLDRNWMNEEASSSQEHFVFDSSYPKYFYVYPPAIDGSKIEISYSKGVTNHAIEDIEEDEYLLDDRYCFVSEDYILYRCFQKDFESVGSSSRANYHYGLASNALGVKIKNDIRLSPNK